MLREHIEYNLWASRQFIAAVESLSDEERARSLRSSFPSILATLHHIYYADKIWLNRITFPYNLAPKPELDYPKLNELLFYWLPVMELWQEWARQHADAMAAEKIAYMTSTGKRYENTIREVILHLVNHDSYHRGQVATMLRQLGYPPPATDLIAYYRRSET
jgi:uncharacterized damage-inducible protein DinB